MTIKTIFRLAAASVFLAGAASAATYSPTGMASLQYSYNVDFSLVGAGTPTGNLIVERDGQAGPNQNETVAITTTVTASWPTSATASDATAISFFNDSNFVFDLTIIVDANAHYLVTDIDPASWSETVDMLSYGRALYTFPDGSTSGTGSTMGSSSYTPDGLFGTDFNIDATADILDFSLMPSQTLTVGLSTFASVRPIPLPASALLLLAGLGALRQAGRRKTQPVS